MTVSFKRIAGCVLCFILPSRIAVILLRCMGHRVAPDVKIGFSLVMVDRLVLLSGSRIGHGNLISVRRLILGQCAGVGRGNIVNGPFSVLLSGFAEIGNRNKVLRGPSPSVTYGPAVFRLGFRSKITSDHRVDCTRSVNFGSDSILAGAGSQCWTHGYVHLDADGGRYRVDGRIYVGNNVYIGSACIINAGVRISDSIIVGSGTTVSGNLLESGLYVSAAIRRLHRPIDPELRQDLTRVSEIGLCERVYCKVDTI